MKEPRGHIAVEVERRMIALEMAPKHLSIAAGLNETYVRDIIKGKSKNPRQEHLAKLADALGCTVEDLMPPNRLMMRGIRMERIKEGNDPSLWTTPVAEMSGLIAMGSGGLVEQDVSPGDWRLPTEWLRQEVRAEPSQLRILTLEGDSMQGTLAPGDKVIVDMSRTLPSPPGLFVVFDGMAMVAKRLLHIEGSEPPRIRLISDNDHYPPYERGADEIKIVGRIMGRWQRLS